MTRIPRNRYAPADRRSADGEVLQPSPDESQRLVQSVARRDGLGMVAVPVEQPLLVAAELEEVVLLGYSFDRPAMDRAVPVDQVVHGVVALARHAVEALIGAQFDVTGVVAGLQQLSDAPVVTRFGRPDEVVVGDVELPPRGAELACDCRGEGFRWLSGRFGRSLDLQTVFVSAREEVHVLAEQAVPAGERVADDRRVGVADVRRGVYVIDRRRHIEAAHEPRVPGVFQLGSVVSSQIARR